MRRLERLVPLSVLTLVVCLTTLARGETPPLAPAETALDRYVHKEDPTYRYEVVNTIKGDGYTTYIVDMVSQTWRTTEDVDRTEWQHWLNIVKPDDVQFDKAMLFIGGGSNGGSAPERADGLATALAVNTKSVVAELKMVPNQPLEFRQDGKRRVEDDLIAYTWIQYMDTGDETWVARLPMVKSAVRAMDTVQSVLATEEAGGLDVDGFVVAGGSKRGWTTWLTGAVDDRVVAIIPIVIDVLNVRESMLHHYAAYGFWAPAIWDYVRNGVTDRQNDPKYDDLLAIVDPLRYRNRLTMPKYVVNAANDQFFLPDSSQFYFDDLEGEKYLRYVPNAGHSLDGSDARQNVQAYYHAILSDRPRPEYSWTLEDDGSIAVTTRETPQQVLLWQATNKRARDFRLEVVGKSAYESSEIQPGEGGKYIGLVDEPKQGFTAYFVELTFDSGTDVPFKFTTPVRVTPDVLPHKDKPLSSSRLNLRSRRRGNTDE